MAYIFNANTFSANTRLFYYIKIHGTANTSRGEKWKKKKKKKDAFIPHRKMETISILRRIVFLWVHLFHLDISNDCKIYVLTHFRNYRA